MSYPVDLGPLVQLLNLSAGSINSNQPDILYRKWHTFQIHERGGEAGRWCMASLQGDWTFERDFSTITFYIRDSKDAMLFKLMWM